MLVEFSFNKIEMPVWAVTVPIALCGIYLFSTFVGQHLLSAPIYASALDWKFFDSDPTIS